MNNSTVAIAAIAIPSTPALAAALRAMNHTQFATEPLWTTPLEVVPMYRIGGTDSRAESEAASRTISEVVERMRRLTDAYGEWQHFDIPAYFDLPKDQTARLVRIRERVSTVHVIFYTDLLLPTFQQTLRFWATHFVPAYQAMDQSAEGYQAFFTVVQPAMIEHWQRLLTVITQTRQLLLEDVSFLAANGVQEERLRWRQWWSGVPVSGLDARLLPELGQISTLTLSLDFPLPIHRQPHRVRRLRQNRERRSAERKRFQG